MMFRFPTEFILSNWTYFNLDSSCFDHRNGALRRSNPGSQRKSSAVNDVKFGQTEISNNLKCSKKPTSLQTYQRGLLVVPHVASIRQCIGPKISIPVTARFVHEISHDHNALLFLKSISDRLVFSKKQRGGSLHQMSCLVWRVLGAQVSNDVVRTLECAHAKWRFCNRTKSGDSIESLNFRKATQKVLVKNTEVFLRYRTL